LGYPGVDRIVRSRLGRRCPGRRRGAV